MRYFISVDIESEHVKNSLMNFTSRIASYGAMTTVDPENLHITLLYLGERDSSYVDELQNSFISTCESVNVGEFRCNIENIGVFPHMNYIKTIWAGAKPREKLEELHMKFSEHMNGVENNEFIPHVTVARVSGIGGDEKTALQDEIESAQQEFGGFDVDSVRLKQSELSEDGPTYRDIEVYDL